MTIVSVYACLGIVVPVLIGVGVFFFISLATARIDADNEIRYEERKLDFFFGALVVVVVATVVGIVTRCVSTHLFRAGIVMNDAFMSYKRPLVNVCRQLSILLLRIVRIHSLNLPIFGRSQRNSYTKVTHRPYQIHSIHARSFFFRHFSFFQTFCQDLLSVFINDSIFRLFFFYMYIHFHDGYFFHSGLKHNATLCVNLSESCCCFVFCWCCCVPVC